jgi:hypothetical protein
MGRRRVEPNLNAILAAYEREARRLDRAAKELGTDTAAGRELLTMARNVRRCALAAATDAAREGVTA